MNTPVRDRLYAINAYLSGSDGKGYDAFKDDIGIDIPYFGHLHLSRKQNLLKEVYDSVIYLLKNDIIYFAKKFDGFRKDVFFDELFRLGDAVNSLNWLLDHYHVDAGQGQTVTTSPGIGRDGNY